MRMTVIDPDSIKTDADVVNIARRMMRLKAELDDCIDVIEQSQHPNAADLAESLRNECWFAAWPTHVISHDLSEPEKWQTDTHGSSFDGYGITHKVARKAAKTRDINQALAVLAD